MEKDAGEVPTPGIFEGVELVIEGEGEALKRAIEVGGSGIEEEEVAEAFGDESPASDEGIAEAESGIVPDKTVAEGRPVGEKSGRDDANDGYRSRDFFQGGDDAKDFSLGQECPCDGGVMVGDVWGGGDGLGWGFGWGEAVGGECGTELECEWWAVAMFSSGGTWVGSGRVFLASALWEERVSVGSGGFGERGVDAAESGAGRAFACGGISGGEDLHLRRGIAPGGGLSLSDCGRGRCVDRRPAFGELQSAFGD